MKSNGFLAWVCTRHYGHLTAMSNRQRGQNKILALHIHTQICSRRNRPSCKGKYQTGSQMGEAQWPEDTASPSMTEATGPIKWVEHNGEESKHPICPPQSGRQTGGELFVDKSSMGSNRLVYRSRFLSPGKELASATSYVRAQSQAEFRANVQS